jgi:hypothetical protein
VNVARTGLSGGPSRFNPGASAKDFNGPSVANQTGFNLGGATPPVNFRNPTGTAFTSPASVTFGQVTTAYSDSSNTQDPGGRLGQIVARINW